ncbi:hypothetical protein LIER_36311 [Lithospermum erythrorhizon]|uniref:DUF4283 domain-containing protein n=1 Tax=Lithospermum erythrorhizon TaxID=34254 RepID=A0AAV3P8R0_LITER
MEEGPWTLAQRPWVLEKWSPESITVKKGVESVHTWVRFPNLILQFWNPEMLRKIGNHIGNPKFSDSTTTGMEKIAYARLCIEVSAKEKLSGLVPLVNERDQEFQQKVVYEWLPPRCSHCHLFGHTDNSCREK